MNGDSQNLIAEPISGNFPCKIVSQSAYYFFLHFGQIGKFTNHRTYEHVNLKPNI